MIQRAKPNTDTMQYIVLFSQRTCVQKEKFHEIFSMLKWMKDESAELFTNEKQSVYNHRTFCSFSELKFEIEARNRNQELIQTNSNEILS